MIEIIITILISVSFSIFSILIYKYYYSCPNEIIEYKYINKSCNNIDEIPTSMLFKNLFDNSEEWIGQQTIYNSYVEKK